MLTPQQREQFSEIFEELAKSLDITKKEYEDAVTSYQFVGRWLAGEDSELAVYQPEILPQGSFLLGTMIRPVHEDDDLDIDLVCRLVGKRDNWAQFHLKQAVGNRLKAHGTLERMLRVPDGRRCWTLDYAEESRFHMDVLPAIVWQGYQILLEKAFSNSFRDQDIASLAIRITDKEARNYKVATDPLEWLLSNMFGYAAWFKDRSDINLVKAINLREAIKPVPTFQVHKTPLQRIVQILKRHRDIMFNGDEDKPISIIITTLAALAYRKQTDIMTGLQEVVVEVDRYIEDHYDPATDTWYKWIGNPVNSLENFADKWRTHPKRQTKFYEWLQAVKQDITYVTSQRQLPAIREALSRPFGGRVIDKVFNNMATTKRELREQGGLRMAAGTGMLGNIGRTSVSDHSFFGSNE
ncbi:nucleotidyltransferase [uncultured Chitinophaga sp.]|jgi:hypothetical protein|uniref:nucleotidyltransferase domain-containing protein n=1 Tax=uncultured Chitinophaga sp. TaxID=339340 RepID=UPI00262936D9|nr:nucleotidyltransferase [uncultured Chitinophaga sp.]